jgi:hypothetical protein
MPLSFPCRKKHNQQLNQDVQELRNESVEEAKTRDTARIKFGWVELLASSFSPLACFSPPSMMWAGVGESLAATVSTSSE